MEPLFLEDHRGNVFPKSLRNLLSALSNDEMVSKNDVVVGLVYILMLETGFVTTDIDVPPEECFSFDFHYQRFLRCTLQLAKAWKKSGGNYSFSFILQPYHKEICRICCVPCCEDLIVNCKIQGATPSDSSILIAPSLYVLPRSDGLKWRFQNLNSLSLLFKNEISYPAKVSILRNYNVSCACLQNLPVEVLLNIFKYLDARTLYKLKEVCVYFQEICLNDRVYKKIH